ncbi:MAG: hypothetical protein LBU35_02335 [Holosporales bacterium]|jgi:hypothetical protein|nr:hypothetical protein [Holosporales bacterium]
MRFDNILPIERISILTRLVLKYCISIDIVEAVKLAKELAAVIDELNYFQINRNKFSSDFLSFFPEHWKKRTQFLLIITKYWPEILKELEKSDIIPEKKSLYFENKKYNCYANGLSDYLDVASIKNKFSFLEADDIFQETNFILKIILENPLQTISIVSPNKSLYEILTLRFSIEYIEYTSYIENYNRNNEYSMEFLAQVEKYFGDFGEIYRNDFDKLIKELLNYSFQEKIKNRISIINISDIKYCFDDIIILSSMNEDYWKIRYKGEYWLHRAIREKIGLNNYESSRTAIEDNFYSVFNGKSRIFFTKTKEVKSSILAKFEAKCKMSGTQIKIENLPHEYSNSEISNNSSIEKLFELPLELNYRSIELLMKNPYAFFAKEMLSITPDNVDSAMKDFAISFKEFMCAYYTDNDKIPKILNKIKEINFFYYQKCKNIADWLTKKELDCGTAFYNILGKAKFSDYFPVYLSSHADKIEIYNDYSILIYYKMKNAESIRIKETDSYLLTPVLIAEKGGFEEDIPPIREIQIWSISSYGKDPIDIRTTEISKETLVDYEKKLEDYLEHYFYKKDGFAYFERRKQEYNGYKHFERKKL